jgi:glycosyltransferase involved in cell wall biosynthesis
MISIAAVLMVKNEENFITTSLNSIKNIVDGIIIFDTGSTDDTINKIKQFANKFHIPYHIKQGVFVDFATSRNELLKMANDLLTFDYLLLLDCGDEYQQDDNFNLRLFLENNKNDSFMIKQKWYTGNTTIHYYNTRLIKNKPGFLYKGSVHEYLKTPNNELSLRINGIALYQDRVLNNDGSTQKRWSQDLILLLKDFKEDPTNARTQYYLGQTYECLNDHEKAKYYYKLRAFNNDGFNEEMFNAALKCVQLEIEEEEKIKWCYISLKIMYRAEPLTIMARFYRLKNNYVLAYHFSKIACDVDYPENCILWVDEKCYNYDRWHELSIASFYVKKYDVGKNACLQALKTDNEKLLNKKNLSFYENVL